MRLLGAGPIAKASEPKRLQIDEAALALGRGCSSARKRLRRARRANPRAIVPDSAGRFAWARAPSGIEEPRVAANSCNSSPPDDADFGRRGRFSASERLCRPRRPGGFSIGAVAPTFLLAVAGSLIAGPALAWLYLRFTAHVQHVPTSIILSFVSTFGVWILADRVGLPGVLTVSATQSPWHEAHRSELPHESVSRLTPCGRPSYS